MPLSSENLAENQNLMQNATQLRSTEQRADARANWIDQAEKSERWASLIESRQVVSMDSPLTLRFNAKTYRATAARMVREDELGRYLTPNEVDVFYRR